MRAAAFGLMFVGGLILTLGILSATVLNPGDEGINMTVLWIGIAVGTAFDVLGVVVLVADQKRSR